MGRTFYEGTAPRIAGALEKLAEKLTQARGFEPGDLVLVSHGGEVAEFRVDRSSDGGLYLKHEDGSEIVIVMKRRIRP